MSAFFLSLYSCILLKFYIKPQPACMRSIEVHCCILLKFYIKPQLYPRRVGKVGVVSYWNSTSNHNTPPFIELVSYWNSTSNHNDEETHLAHKPVVSYWNSTSNHNVRSIEVWPAPVVSYWNSTSNHNCNACDGRGMVLYLIEILHQTTTLGRRAVLCRRVVSYWNSTSNHNPAIRG